ncbi:MAG TPA: hypothetical protein VEY71_07060, partial [Chitinophagales bacterium]|nr:hypothetical protein [Chitinophagales bacterium]
FFGSIKRWLFEMALKATLVDVNAVEALIPLNPLAPSAEYKKPFPYVFNSERVLDFVDGEFCVIHSTDKSSYTTGTGQAMYDGDVYYVLTRDVIQRYRQVSMSGEVGLEWEYAHKMGYMPARKLPGVFKEAKDNCIIRQSRIAPVLPRLKEAVREYNDLQAGVVLNLFLERWQIATKECMTCNGLGTIPGGEHGTIGCTTCKGSGKRTDSPFTEITVIPTGLGQTQLPTPPAGYLQKDVRIIEIQDERVEKHMFKALAAINMEHLAKVPLAQSGIAKEVDRDEMNNFVHSVAEDLIDLLVWTYQGICDMRYGATVKDATGRAAMLPKVVVPKRFDLLSVQYLIEEYKAAKEAKMSGVVLGAMQVEITAKRFAAEPEIKDELTSIHLLDPLPDMDTEQKMAAVMNGFITKKDAVISANIVQFVRRAIFEKKESFFTLTRDKKLEILTKYADEKMNENSAAAKVLATALKSEDEEQSGSEQPGGEHPLNTDSVGKIPLALQQLALARERAINAGDKALANQLGAKMKELLVDLTVEVE